LGHVVLPRPALPSPIFSGGTLNRPEFFGGYLV
jgi:hypothetical protein